jgi:hypothetical protein
MRRLISQVCAYANWPDESFEVWRWYDYNREIKQIAKEMRNLFLRIYSNVAITKSFEDLKQSVFTVGMVYPEEVTLSRSEIEELSSVLRFGWYKGYCLDMERLQYFVPEKIIIQGWVKVIDIDKKEAYAFEKSKKRLSNSRAVEFLKLRRSFRDDPKGVLVNELRYKLGLDWNYLFEKKTKFSF